MRWLLSFGTLKPNPAAHFSELAPDLKNIPNRAESQCRRRLCRRPGAKCKGRGRPRPWVHLAGDPGFEPGQTDPESFFGLFPTDRRWWIIFVFPLTFCGFVLPCLIWC